MSDMKDLPLWLQELWNVNSTLARQAEKGITTLQSQLTLERKQAFCVASDLVDAKAELAKSKDEVTQIGIARNMAEREHKKAISALSTAEGEQAAILSFINAQAEDEGLWCEAEYCSEAYIQGALRGVHAFVESVFKDGVKALTGKEGGE